MFANIVQPSVISLFSSTSSQPLQLFSQHVDPSPALRPDSLIHFLDDATSTPHPPAPGCLVRPAPVACEDDGDGSSSQRNKKQGRMLCQTVLHIQSPTMRTTYIRSPPAPRAAAGTSDPFVETELGITLPWVHLQVRSLGREWAFEVGVADRAGKNGVVRCSTFQREASLKCHQDPPLLHIPLRFPSASSRPLTTWSTISLDLSAMTQQFHIIAAAQQADLTGQDAYADGDDEDSEDEGITGSARQLEPPHNITGANVPLPSGTFGKVLYVKVYANCRLRRIWFSEGRRGALPWEFALYASSQE